MRLAILLPAISYRKMFFESWILLQSWLESGEVVTEYIISTAAVSDVYQARNLCVLNALELPPLGEGVKVLGGKEYDKMLWMDSDQVFTVDDVKKIISHDVDVVTGIVPIGMENRTCIGRWSTPEEMEKGQVCYYSLSGLQELANGDGLVPIEFSGFGFICMKQGVMERIGYPWFRHTVHKINGIKTLTTEEIGWCVRAKELGIKIYADPEVRVGHEKSMLLTSPG